MQQRSPSSRSDAQVEGLLQAVESQVRAAGQPVELVQQLRQELQKGQHPDRPLQPQEQEFAALVQNAADIIARFDRQLRCQYVNPAVEPYTGLRPEQFIGKTHREAGFPPSLYELWETKLREAFDAKQKVTFEFPFSSPTGRPYCHECWLVPEIDPATNQVQSVMCVGRDVSEAKQAEARLQQNEARLQMVIEHAPTAIAMFDRQMRYLMVSQRWMTDYHLGDQNILGRSHYEIFPETPERWKQIHQRCLAGASESCDADPFPRADGTLDWVRWDIQPWYEANGQQGGIFILTEVITRRKEAEQALRESEERFRLLVEGVREYALFLLDAQGRIASWNSGAERIKGYQGDEVLGRHVSICYTPEDADQGKPQCNLDLAAQQGRCEWEGWVVRKDGSRFWAEVLLTALRNEDGTIRGYAELARDITQRKQAEEALRASENWLRLAVEATDLGVWNYYPPSGTLLWSDRCKAMFDFAVDTCLTYDLFLTRVHPDDGEYVHRSIQQSCDPEGTGTQDMEYRALWPDGTQRWIKVKGQTFFAGAGSARYAERIVGTAQDITQRRATEGQLQAARESSESANKAKDQFVAVLSHELRTPLTPILTAMQMMEQDAALSTEQRETAQMVQRNVALETRLIDDLLDVTRISRGKLELHVGPVDLHSLLRHVVGLCETDLRSRQLRQTVELTAPRHHLWGDPARLEQVFWNLLKNAIKFTPEGGRITLRTEQAAEECITVTVQDTGVGIEPALLPRIFNAFEQGSKQTTVQFGGLGLGLAISKGVVDLHGGTLTVSSAGKGKGATFTVSLRTSALAEPATPRPGSRANASAGLKGARLLLVEDHPDTAAVMTRLLRSYGYVVQTAGGLASARQAATTTDFDLLVSDIGLPDGSGLDLMRQLSQEHPIKGIALSGYGMEDDIRRSKEAGFSEHLTKPVDLTQLHSAIERILVQH